MSIDVLDQEIPKGALANLANKKREKKSVSFDSSVRDSSEEKTQQSLNEYRNRSKSSPGQRRNLCNTCQKPVVNQRNDLQQDEEAGQLATFDLRRHYIGRSVNAHDLRIHEGNVQRRPRKSAGDKTGDDNKKDSETETK